MDTITKFNGGTTFAGPKAVNVLRLATIISGLRFEARCPGMQLTRGRSCTAIAKDITGLRTRDRAKLIDAMQKLLEQAKAEVTYQEEAK